jgi:hypothetical protein
LARRRNNHLRLLRRRMTWFHSTKNKRQAEDKPKPASYFFEPAVPDFFNGFPEDGTPEYYAKDLVDGIQDKDANK